MIKACLNGPRAPGAHPALPMLARGRDVRVGLEDVLTLPDGRLARDNAELVATAVVLTRRTGFSGPASEP